MDRQYLHVLPDARYADDFISTLINLFGETPKHQFFLKTPKPCKRIHFNQDHLTPIPQDDPGYVRWLNQIPQDAELLIHYLDKRSIECILKSDIKAKVGWVFWGADFYSTCPPDEFIFPESRRGFTQPIGHKWPIFRKMPLLRKLDLTYNTFFKMPRKQKRMQAVLKRIDYIYAFNEFEIELIKKFYDFQGQQKNFMYPRFFASPTFDTGSTRTTPIDNIDGVRIMIGNSATPYINHLEAIQRLPQGNGFHVFTPLSYGDQHYASYLIKKASAELGSHFHPFMEYFETETYFAILQKMSIFCSASIRSIGMGNITTFLYFGIPVLLDPKNPASTYLKKKGFQIFDFDQKLSATEIESIANLKPISGNSELAKHLFSLEQTTRNYAMIFP